MALLLAGFAVRLRVHANSPLPSEQPALWFAAGFAEDAAIAGLAAAVVLALSRVVFDGRWGPRTFGVVAVLLVAGQIAWSEVLIFFGQVPPPNVVAEGLNLTFMRGAAQGVTFQRTLLSLFVFAALLGVCAIRAKNARWAWSRPGRLLVAASVSAGAAFALPADIHRRETARHFLVARTMTSKAVEVGSGRPPPVSRPGLDPIRVRELAPNVPLREYLSESAPLAYRPPRRSDGAPRLPAGTRPNLVFLLLEGVRAEEVGAYGGNPQGLTPNLDRLAREGILVERAFSVGQRTPDAELALWYGIHPHPESLLMTAHPRTRLAGLPDILGKSGWQTLLWIHNGDQGFYQRDVFYLSRGFRLIDGRDFPRDDPRTSWGYSDRALARRAVEALDRSEEPFAALALTVSNHHPYQVPTDAGSRFAGLPKPSGGFRSILSFRHQVGLQTVPMLETVHYTDEAVGDFFRLAASRPWFRRTVFVIAGDHGLAVVPYARPLATLATLADLRHRIPLILYSPMLRPGRVSGPASHTDLAETLLALAAIEGPRAGTGRDLLDPEQFDPDHRIVTWSVVGRLVTVVGSRRTYHAVVHPVTPGASPAFSEEILLDPVADPDGKRNLLTIDDEETRRSRRLARVYLEVYPWLLLSGRSGLPDRVPSNEEGPRQ